MDHRPLPPEYKTLSEWIGQAKRIVFFGGAGVSTESGIPDFRSVDGLYHQQYDVPPETILSRGYFMRKPEEFFRFYRAKMLPLEAQPNAAHRYLAQLEQAGRLTCVVTQNIDGLHQKAGSTRVVELHGSVWRNHCMKCAAAYSPYDILNSPDPVPRCRCGGIIKPDVVLYEESLDDDDIEQAYHAISTSDLMIVAGTSLTVYPAAGLVRYAPGRLVLINRDPTGMDSMTDLVIRDNIGDVFGALPRPE